LQTGQFPLKLFEKLVYLLGTSYNHFGPVKISAGYGMDLRSTFDTTTSNVFLGFWYENNQLLFTRKNGFVVFVSLFIMHLTQK